MLESVIIVLNERETHKAKIAEDLANELQSKNITVFRLEIGPKIIETLLNKTAQVLVLDYLLGDITTGLDVLTALKQRKAELFPEILFLTDEPSLSVAVDAMRLGARHYIEIDNPQAVSIAAQEISEILSQQTSQIQLPQRKSISLSDLIAEASSTAEAKRRAELVIAKQEPVCLIFGPKGSGRETFAQALQDARKSESAFKQIDLQNWDGSFRDFFPIPDASKIALKLGKNLSLCVLNLEQDSGELLRLVTDSRDQLWPSGQARDSFLTVCTNCPKTLESWKALFPNLAILRLEALDGKRIEDIPALLQRFSLDLKKTSGVKANTIDSSTAKAIQKLDWPGGLAQLEAVVKDALICSAKSESSVQELIERGRELWLEENSLYDELPLSKGAALRELEFTGFDYRIAAARLGCSPTKLRALVG